MHHMRNVIEAMGIRMGITRKKWRLRKVAL
jgi:hypothetical protein